MSSWYSNMGFTSIMTASNAGLPHLFKAFAVFALTDKMRHDITLEYF